MSGTQALRLRELVRQRKGLLSYTLSLSPVEVKRGALKRVAKGDLILLKTKVPSLCLCRDGKVAASCELLIEADRKRVRVTALTERSKQKPESKKYEVLFPQITEVETPEVAVDDLIDISDVDMSKISLTSRGREVASGHLVVVEKRIAVMIDRCNVKGKR